MQVGWHGWMCALGSAGINIGNDKPGGVNTFNTWVQLPIPTFSIICTVYALSRCECRFPSTSHTLLRVWHQTEVAMPCCSNSYDINMNPASLICIIQTMQSIIGRIIPTTFLFPFHSNSLRLLILQWGMKFHPVRR